MLVVRGQTARPTPKHITISVNYCKGFLTTVWTRASPLNTRGDWLPSALTASFSGAIHLLPVDSLVLRHLHLKFDATATAALNALTLPKV